ncbi:hypothetical protein KI387_013114, partial [Taxus chinensis]
MSIGGIGEDLMVIPINCVLEMGNWLASTSMGKRAESRYMGFWVADGECSPRGKDMSIGSMIGGGDDGSSYISGGTDGHASVGGRDNRCSSLGGGDNGSSSMGGRGTIGKGYLSGEARGEIVSMLAEDPSIGDEGDERCFSIDEGTREVGSNAEGGFRARISSIEGIW